MKPFVFVICAVFALSVCMPANAVTSLSQDEQPWRMMEKAQLAFEQSNFGLAVRLAEDAKQNKAKEYAWFLSTLSTELKQQQVQRAGDSIRAVQEQLMERNSYVAIEILSHFIDTNEKDFFQNKVSLVLDHISRMGILPEADILIGDTYVLTGEVELAKEYYLKAWKAAYGLDIPDSKYDILYKLADIAIMQEDDISLEQSLLLVLADNPYYNGEARFSENKEAARPYLRAIIQSITRGYSVDRVFLLYRANWYHSLKAFIMLANFYKRVDDAERFLETAALGSLTAFTRVYEIVAERDLDFAYTTLDAFFAKSMRYTDVQNWMTTNAAWDSFLLLADAVAIHGQKPFADGLRQILVKYAPANIAVSSQHAQ